MNSILHDDGDMLKDMASRLVQLENVNARLIPAERVRRLMLISEQCRRSEDDDDAIITITPLSSCSNDSNGGGMKRRNWIICHTGRRHLSCVLFKRPGDITELLVDEIVSLKDDIGTNYTSFVHLAASSRATIIENILRIHTTTVSDFKVIDISQQTTTTMLNSRHFRKIAEGVRSENKNLSIDSINDPLNHRNYKVLNMFFRHG